MGYAEAIVAVLLIIVTTRTHFHAQISSIIHRQLPLLLTHPRLHAFINRHPRLYALLHRNSGPQPLIHPPQPRPPSLGASPLGRLAPEIIQHIASLLPPSAAASFASTCLPIRLITGTTYLASLRASPFETLTLLEYLTLDLPTSPTTSLPSHLLCLFCRRLVPYPSLCSTAATPYCKNASTQCQPYVPSRFCPQFLHTVMAQYRRGRSPYPLLNTLKSLSTATTSHDGDAALQTALEYRIIQGSLYQRVRKAFILPRCETNYVFRVQPCLHYATYQARMDREAVAMQDLARDRSGMRACSEMVSCQHCRTVLRVGCRKFRGLGLGLFVTWWIDLGDGQWVSGKREGLGWKDVKYSRKWLTDYFESLCHSERYFDFEGMDTRADRKELLAIARRM